MHPKVKNFLSIFSAFILLVLLMVLHRELGSSGWWVWLLPIVATFIGCILQLVDIAKDESIKGPS